MDTKIINPDDVAFAYLNELIDMLKHEASNHSYIVSTEALLTWTLTEIEGKNEHIAARTILQNYGGALSFTEFYLPCRGKRGRKFDETKEKLYLRGVELLGGEDVSKWFRESDATQNEKAPSGWEIGLIVTGGAVATPIFWNFWPNAIAVCVWFLVVFFSSVSILPRQSTLIRVLISIAATIFSALIGLILVSLLFVERF